MQGYVTMETGFPKSLDSLLFSNKRCVTEESMANIPQKSIKTELDDSSKYKDAEMYTLINSNYNKAPGSEGLPAEVFKIGGTSFAERLEDLAFEITLLNPYIKR